MGVENARRAHNDIDSVPFDEVKWRCADQCFDIENRFVSMSHFAPLTWSPQVHRHGIGSIGARSEDLDRTDREVVHPPPPLRRSKHKNLKASPHGK